MPAPWKESCDKPRQHTKKQRHHFANRGPYSENYGFPVVMYESESQTIKKTECQRMKFLNSGAAEDPWEFLGQQGNQTSQSEKNQP